MSIGISPHGRQHIHLVNGRPNRGKRCNWTAEGEFVLLPLYLPPPPYRDFCLDCFHRETAEVLGRWEETSPSCIYKQLRPSTTASLFLQFSSLCGLIRPVEERWSLWWVNFSYRSLLQNHLFTITFTDTVHSLWNQSKSENLSSFLSIYFVDLFLMYSTLSYRQLSVDFYHKELL